MSTPRFDDQRAAQQLRRFVEPFEILERKREIVERVGIVGSQFQRLAVDGLGLLGALELAQAGAEIVPGVDEVRLQFEGAAIGELGFGKALEALQRVAAIAVRLARSRLAGRWRGRNSASASSNLP